jgi:hypothetical protein
MRTTFFQFFVFFILIMLILSACNLPVNNPTASSPARIEPSLTVEAMVDATATQAVEVPSATLAATATQTLTPEASATATAEIPIAEVVRLTNCRTGPAGNYDLVAKYEVGQKLNIVARDLGSAYWFVSNPEKPDEQCYLMAQNVKVSGDTAVLPKFTPLASPTSIPDFKMTFKKFDICKGQSFAIFIVENTGSTPFRSAYIKVTDLKVNKSVEQALNAFNLHVGCTLAKNLSPLNPGETGYVESAPFEWNHDGHKLRVTIMLCTEQNLKKVCVDQTMQVNP